MQDATIDMERNVVIISDRQKGLTEAVSCVLTNVHYNYCLLHLVQNFYGMTKDNMAQNYILTTAREFTESGFDKTMTIFQSEC